MVFFSRTPRRRWLRNLPIIPTDVREGEIYTYTYTYETYAGFETNTFTFQTPLDRSRYPSMEAHEPISFDNFDTEVRVLPNRLFRLDLSDFVRGSQPIKYYFTKRPYWLGINGSVLSSNGNVPSSFPSANIEVRLLIENPAGSAVLELSIIVLLTFIEGNTYELDLSDFFPPNAFTNIDRDRIQVAIQELRPDGDPTDNNDWVHVYDTDLNTELTANYVSSNDKIYIRIPYIPGEVLGGRLRILVTIADE